MSEAPLSRRESIAKALYEIGRELLGLPKTWEEVYNSTRAVFYKYADEAIRQCDEDPLTRFVHHPNFRSLRGPIPFGPATATIETPIHHDLPTKTFDASTALEAAGKALAELESYER